MIAGDLSPSLRRIRARGLRSKLWEEFATSTAPVLDVAFTVCDNAAGEVCPVWPGQPMTAHWEVADPAAGQGTDAERVRAFRDVFVVLERRIGLLVSLPFARLDRLSLPHRLKEIGRS